MEPRQSHASHYIYWLIGLFVILSITVGAAIWYGVQTDRRSAAYPNSRTVSQHSRYKFPRHYRWDDTFVTTDKIDQVFRWYSVTFDTGPESEANGGCSLIEGDQEGFYYKRYAGIMICEMGHERMIFINRTTELFPRN
ncbi:MAG: hypothetical protein AAF633_13410 [Chloroflexota bacterium]